jgi:hypothetical protein
MKRFIDIACVLFIIATAWQNLSAEETERYENPWEPWRIFFENYYSKPDYVENHVYLDLSAGFASFRPKKNLIHDNFAATYSTQFAYGFIRYDYETGIPGMFKHERDYFSVGVTSSNFKTFDSDYSLLNTHSWIFGPAIENGFGYEVFDGRGEILLKHSAGLNWFHIDFDGLGSGNNESYMRRYDEKYKFGTTWSGGIEYRFNDYFAVACDYEKSLVLSDFKFLPWTGIFLIDNAAQKWIDFFEPEMIERMGKNWGVVKFLYKNFVSFLLYSVRTENQYFPFPTETDAPIVIDTYRISISFSL